MAASEKNQLIEQHLSLVQAIAHKVKKSLTTSIDVEDLIGYGSKGLVEAAERFDARQGVAFSTFAYYRIRGAMYDGLRTMGWYSRADYARYRAEERANEYLQSQADREGAALADGAVPAGGSTSTEQKLDEIATALTGVATVHITSLEAAAHVADERLPPPDAALEMRQETGRLRQALSRLPEKERRLMELYYLADKNLEEAGRELGLSKSWACRLHARAVDLLRVEMADPA
ncbi:MAG TPA: sigma-70 family RNA polymerase sigma factor [Polyangia bacterium]|jgi:RNA polymerase sigma factor for flagellar operon FliA|nr:sigma-70 family RNA polymerase sigma factor [Polyangia bacterium]